MSILKKETKRIELLDELRGFAIIAMIIHHTFLDIGDVLSADWGYTVFNKLCTVQPVFWAIFIIISGICTRLSRNTVKRGCIVLGAGLIVTLVTAVIMPKMNMAGAEIYFGILSCLGACMIITGLFMPVLEKCSTKIGLTVCAILFTLTYSISSGSLLFGLIPLPDALYAANYFMPLGFYNSSFHSADYFPLLPWLFMFLFGSFLGKFAKDGSFPQWTYKRRAKLFAFVGRNSLWFYLAHQVVIYAVLYAFLYITVFFSTI